MSDALVYEPTEEQVTKAHADIAQYLSWYGKGTGFTQSRQAVFAAVILIREEIAKSAAIRKEFVDALAILKGIHAELNDLHKEAKAPKLRDTLKPDPKPKKIAGKIAGYNIRGTPITLAGAVAIERQKANTFFTSKKALAKYKNSLKF